MVGDAEGAWVATDWEAELVREGEARHVFLVINTSADLIRSRST
jgi:hypothetical protein